MTWGWKAMAVWLALVWAPMTSHCDLEHLPGMEFVACCDLAAPDSHQERDCQADTCASVESGHYKTEEQGVCVPPPPVPSGVPLLSLSNQSPRLSQLSPRPAEIRNELPRRWAFTLRLASLPRAPSVA